MRRGPRRRHQRRRGGRSEATSPPAGGGAVTTAPPEPRRGRRRPRGRRAAGGGDRGGPAVPVSRSRRSCRSSRPCPSGCEGRGGRDAVPGVGGRPGHIGNGGVRPGGDPGSFGVGGPGPGRPVVITHHHVDDHHGDVVVAAVLIGHPHQRLGRLLRIVRRCEDVRDAVRGHLVGESVRAQDVAVATFGLDLPGVDLHLGGDAEGPRQDVPLGMNGRFGLRKLAPGHELLRHRVVGGELLQSARTEPVGARVPHVGEDQAVAAVRRHQGRRGQGRSHTAQVGVVAAPVEDGLVGTSHRLDQTPRRGVATETALEAVHRQARGHLATGVATHAVGHSEQRDGLEGQILVDGPDPADVGCRSRPQDGHGRLGDAVTGSPRRRCRPPGRDHRGPDGPGWRCARR